MFWGFVEKEIAVFILDIQNSHSLFIRHFLLLLLLKDQTPFVIQHIHDVVCRHSPKKESIRKY